MYVLMHVCIIVGGHICVCHSVSAYMYVLLWGHVCTICVHACMYVLLWGHVCTIVWVLTCMYVLLRGTCVCHSVSACMHVCVIVGGSICVS